MDYRYEREVEAAASDPNMKGLNLVMGRGKKQYATFLAQKTGLKWDDGRTYADMFHTKYVWGASLGPTSYVSLTMQVYAMAGTPVLYNVTFMLETPRGSKWSQEVKGMEADEFKNPAFVIPPDLLKQVTYEASGSNTKEQEELIATLKQAAEDAKQRAEQMTAASKELESYTTGDTADAVARIKKNVAAVLKAYEVVTPHSRELEKLIGLAIKPG